jgi:hypothetical protein
VAPSAEGYLGRSRGGREGWLAPSLPLRHERQLVGRGLRQMAGCGGSQRLGCSGSPRWLLLAVVRLGSDLGPYEHGRPRFFIEVFDAMAALWNFLGDED